MPPKNGAESVSCVGCGVGVGVGLGVGVGVGVGDGGPSVGVGWAVGKAPEMVVVVAFICGVGVWPIVVGESCAVIPVGTVVVPAITMPTGAGFGFGKRPGMTKV